MNIIIALCLVTMISIVVWNTAKICLSKREDRLRNIKNFKLGDFALIYLATIPLYFMAFAYSGRSVGESFFSSIMKAFDLVVLKFEFADVASLMADNVLFNVTIYICYFLILANAFLFTFTLVWQRLSNHLRRIKATRFSKNVCVVIDYNEKNASIIKTASKNGADTIILTQKKDGVADFAFINKVNYYKLGEIQNIDFTLEKLFHNNFRNKSIKIIVNTESDRDNVVITERICKLIEKIESTDRLIDDPYGISCFVFGDMKNASTFNRFVEKSNGAVHHVNKYELIAMDFLDKYPITQFMSNKMLDFNTATVNDDVDVNVVLIGFGDVNQQLFLASVANNQLLTEINGILVNKQVNYHIFDKDDTKNDKNLNHNYFRFVNELSDNPDDYLPLPAKPAKEFFHTLDVNDTHFYSTLRDSISYRPDKTPYNYIVIAYGDDMENLDFAEKINSKLLEWNLDSVSKVFVRIKDGSLTDHVINEEYAENGNFFTFGNENKIVFDYNCIVAEKQQAMARDKHLSYSLKSGMSITDERTAKVSAQKKWFSSNNVQRESNVFACLGIRLKLQLLGFDYCSVNDPRPSVNDQFMTLYQKNDAIKYENCPAVDGRKPALYSNDFVKGSVRYHLAVLEHERWNAYMISCGIIPSTKEQIIAEGAKNLKLRRHSNITTFEGLIQFRKMMAEINGCSEEDTDVIRYDYQIMDDVVWLLNKNGYKIVKR